MRTHPVDKLLEQHCYKSAASLLQLVRFYVCTSYASASFLIGPAFAKRIIALVNIFQILSGAINIYNFLDICF